MKKYFPLKTPRDGQLEVIQKIADAIADPKIKHVVLEAPTGSGKSVIAKTLCNWYKDNYSSTRTVTVTKLLQDQYLRDFNMDDIRNKTDEKYKCSIGETYNTSPCVDNQKATKYKCFKSCPYKLAMKQFIASQEQLTNAHFTMALGQNVGLMILDECHLIGSIAAQLSELRASIALFNNTQFIDGNVKNSVTEAYYKFSKYLSGYKVNQVITIRSENWLDEAKDAVVLMTDEKIRLEDVLKRLGRTSTNLFLRDMKRLENMISTFRKLIHVALDKKFILYELTDDSFVLKPIYVSDFTEKLLFSKAEKFVHMSATICGYETYLKEMGIAPDEAVFIELENNMPVENRRVVFSAVSNMSFKNYDSDVKKTVEFIDEILNESESANGIIHTVSYKRAQDIKRQSKFSSKIVVCDAHESVDRLSKQDTGTIVASPSLTAGVDYPDDMCRMQFVVKMPYPSTTDPRIKYLMENEPKMYAQGVVRDVVQSCGRAIRHEDDWALTWIIDGNFKRLYSFNRDLFPSWFSESLVM